MLQLRLGRLACLGECVPTPHLLFLDGYPTLTSAGILLADDNSNQLHGEMEDLDE